MVGDQHDRASRHGRLARRARRVRQRRAGEAGGDEFVRAAAAFQIRMERAWGQMQSATGATSLEALEQRVTATKQVRDEVSRAMDDLLRVGAARGLPVEAIRQKYNAWTASFQKALATVETGASVRAADLASGEYAVSSTTAIRAFDALVEFQGKRMTDAVARAKAESSEGQTMLLAVLAGALLLGLAIATWLAVTISRGLSRAVSLADAVSMGDLSQTVTVTSRDEIGDLVIAMNRMTANLNATAGLADAIAGGDLTVEAKPCPTRTGWVSPSRPCWRACAPSWRTPPRRRATSRRAARNCRPRPSSCRRARPSRPPPPRKPPPRWRRWPPT